jgi:hypothetical protein
MKWKEDDPKLTYAEAGRYIRRSQHVIGEIARAYGLRVDRSGREPRIAQSELDKFLRYTYVGGPEAFKAAQAEEDRRAVAELKRESSQALSKVRADQRQRAAQDLQEARNAVLAEKVGTRAFAVAEARLAVAQAKARLLVVETERSKPAKVARPKIRRITNPKRLAELRRLAASVGSSFTKQRGATYR